MILIIIIGIALVVGGIWSFSLNKRFLKTAIQTEGTIVEIESARRTNTDEDGYSKNYTVYIPHIQFEDKEKEYTIKGNVESKNKNKYKIGNTLTIFYDPQNPSKAKVKSTINNWLMPIVLILVGAMMVAIGIGGIAS